MAATATAPVSDAGNSTALGDVLNMTSSIEAVLAGVKAATAAGQIPETASALSILHTQVAGDAAGAATFKRLAGFADVQAAAKTFQWEETVQLQAIKIAQAYAGHYHSEAGAEGAVDLVANALEALPESLPCAITGIRAVGVMVVTRPNLVRAKLAGIEDAVAAAVEVFHRDGELQFRASQLAAALATISEKEAEREAPKTASKWGRLKVAVSEGRARDLARGSLPGFSGVSAVVADKAKEGMAPLVAHLQACIDTEEVVYWCMDALATAVEGDASVAAAAVAAGAPEALVAVIQRHKWSERTVEACIRAGTALAPFAAAECTAAGLLAALVVAMTASDSSYAVQSTAVRLLLVLTSAHPPALRASLDAGVPEAVRTAIDSNPDDGQLQWRGMNLLDALKPGQGEEVRERALRRSFSSFLRRKDSRAQMGGSFVERKPVVPAASEAALKDVLDMAEVVEEDEDGDEEDGE